MKKNIRSNKLLLIAAFITSFLYILWRIFFTIPFSFGLFSATAGIILVLAELTGMVESMEHCMSMIRKFTPEKPALSEEEYPEVDVFISTYNESEELLYKTLNACLHMDYPDPDKVHIYLCDDQNRGYMKKFAEQMNVQYISRDTHKDAKAGNLNNALKQTTSPLIVTFDADMIPLHDFLMATVPYFALPETGFVQTPQSFYNADLFQYNLYSEQEVPNEQDYFFRDVNVGRNSTNSPIYAGSNTVISRKALLEAGGFYTGVITEDFATGIMIQNAGYTCYALDEVHAIGLSPKDLKSLITQRERWGRGCIQTFYKIKLWGLKNLSLHQKFSYTSCLLYWYTYLRRAIYIIAPILFGVFGIRVVDCTLTELAVFWLPSYLLYNKAIAVLSGNIRTNRWSNIYDTILMPALLYPMLLESLGIRKKEFFVTHKDKQETDKSYHIKKSIPHMILALLSCIGIFNCIKYTLQFETLEYVVILFWLLTNLYHIVMSIFFMHARNSYRNSERFHVSLDVTITADDWEIKGLTKDISEGGFSFISEHPVYIPSNQKLLARIKCGSMTAECLIEIMQVIKQNGKWHYGSKIIKIEEPNKSIYYRILYDREPTLPKYIKSSLSIFDDIYNNIHKRLQQPIPAERRLPRVTLNAAVKTTKGDSVVIRDFNYEYLTLLKDNGSSIQHTEHLSFMITDNFLLQCSFVEEKEILTEEKELIKYRLYKVTNLEEFAFTDVFAKHLAKWIFAHQEACLKAAEIKNLEKEDRLDEMELLNLL